MATRISFNHPPGQTAQLSFSSYSAITTFKVNPIGLLAILTISLDSPTIPPFLKTVPQPPAALGI